MLTALAASLTMTFGMVQATGDVLVLAGDGALDPGTTVLRSAVLAAVLVVASRVLLLRRGDRLRRSRLVVVAAVLSVLVAVAVRSETWLPTIDPGALGVPSSSPAVLVVVVATVLAGTALELLGSWWDRRAVRPTPPQHLRPGPLVPVVAWGVLLYAATSALVVAMFTHVDTFVAGRSDEGCTVVVTSEQVLRDRSTSVHVAAPGSRWAYRVDPLTDLRRLATVSTDTFSVSFDGPEARLVVDNWGSTLTRALDCG